MIENPSQSEVSHAYPFRNHPPNFIDGIKRSFEIDARERFPAIELLAVSIEVSMKMLKMICTVAIPENSISVS